MWINWDYIINFCDYCLALKGEVNVGPDLGSGKGSSQMAVDLESPCVKLMSSVRVHRLSLMLQHSVVYYM